MIGLPNTYAEVEAKLMPAVEKILPNHGRWLHS